MTLRPVPLLVPPRGQAELACDISGYYPLGVSVSWEQRGSESPQRALTETWESGHRQSPDGTYSLTSFARLVAIEPKDHDASYSCHIAHVGLGPAGLRKAVKLQVAGKAARRERRLPPGRVTPLGKIIPLLSAHIRHGAWGGRGNPTPTEGQL